MSKKRKPVIQHAPTIAKRDGWQCVYCGKSLIPSDVSEPVEPYYTYHIFRVSTLPHLIVWRGIYEISPDYDLAEVDHVIPVTRGGSDDLGNLALACQKCNRQKTNKTADEYRKWINGGKS